MNILVTGGAGYVGSHIVKELLPTDSSVVTFDNFQKGHRQAVLGGDIVRGDLQNRGEIEAALREYNVEVVVHMAASSLVGESVEKPQLYYQNNVVAGLNLLEAMRANGVNKLVFSSTAAVYGEAENVPITTAAEAKPGNPYGRSKLYFEEILADYLDAHGFQYVSLRYFNASGADPSGRIGEDHEPETHLIPLVLQTALGQRDELTIFGTDYETRDGTCIRDYVHVTDLARAHVLAIEALLKGRQSGVYNLGSGSGYSVKEVIETARQVTGREIPARPGARRPGDPPVLIASSKKIEAELGWEPRYDDLEYIIETAWNWHENHPHGYQNGED